MVETIKSLCKEKGISACRCQEEWMCSSITAVILLFVYMAHLQEKSRHLSRRIDGGI